ncbi:MAG: arylesterase [Hyphomicrobiales bacterium]|nr:arylesterase [Hyphomicrobiales bacterium]
MHDVIWRNIAAFTRAAAVLGALAGTAARAETPLTIVAFGDSLTAGYQLPPDKSFPAQLEKALRAKGYDVRVENAGVSGETAAEGLARLDWALSGPADAVIVELGANDALRGLPTPQTEKALDQILARLAARGVPVLLAGMEAPRNMGRDYTDAFRAIYPRLAEKHGALLYPFFLEGVAMNRALNLPDGIHPTAEGVAEIVKNITPNVEALIARAQARKTPS